MLKEKSLVLYKQSPAIISAVEGDKIHIQLQKGSKKVRLKDVTLLHPGPANSLGDIVELEGDPGEAWELFQGETPTAEDLAELIYGEFSPAAAWSIYLLINRTQWFRGSWDEIQVTTVEEREAREKADREKENTRQRWDDFCSRLKKGSFLPEDHEYFDELKQQARGLVKRSAILKELKKEQKPENAHQLLLKWKMTEYRWNPFPERFGVSLHSSMASLNSLPEEERLDLTSVTAYAIDDRGSKDPDDAIAWDGTYFWVHIADAAALVPRGCDADLDARSRGGNLYLPEGTVTMLPSAATEQLALGLQPQRSPAFSFRFLLDDQGRVAEGDIFLSWIKVERLSYEDCDSRMDQSPFKEMKALTDRFSRHREEEGATSIQLPEVKIRVNQEGKVDISPLEDLSSRRMVAESMMMTGNWAASYCLRQSLAIPFASQPTPDQTPPEGEGYSVQFARRKLMQRSRVSLTPSRHSGLGLDVYTRVTSPLRRYSDLVVMQQLRGSLKGEAPLTEEEVTLSSAACEALSSSLNGAERQSNMHWKLVYLQDQDSWEGEGVFAERRDRQMIFVIPQLAMEARIASTEKKALDSRAVIQFQQADFVNNQASFKIKEWLD